MPIELIHTMLRILDEERSLAFYSALGFEERRRARVGGDTATIIFMGLPGDGDRLELTVGDLDEELARLAESGITADKPPYEASPGGPRICFVTDPDGYRTELIE